MSEFIAPWAQTGALKIAFAAALLRTPNDAFNAARTVFGDDTQSAMRAAMDWPFDPIVLKEQERLIEEHGEKHFMPSKWSTARKAYEIAANTQTEPKLKLYALDLYSKIMGYIEKPEPPVINNNLTVNQNKVMVIRDHGSNDEWEEKLKTQQAKLIAHSRD